MPKAGKSVKVHPDTGKLDQRTKEARAIKRRQARRTLKVKATRRDFIRALGEQCGVVKWACEAINVKPDSAYYYRTQFPDFAEAWDETVRNSLAALEAEAQRRALDGSDSLLMFLLKSRAPEIYRERYDIKHSGSIGTGVDEKTDEELLDIARRGGSGTVGEETGKVKLPGLH